MTKGYLKCSDLERREWQQSTSRNHVMLQLYPMHTPLLGKAFLDLITCWWVSSELYVPVVSPSFLKDLLYHLCTRNSFLKWHFLNYAQETSDKGTILEDGTATDQKRHGLWSMIFIPQAPVSWLWVESAVPHEKKKVDAILKVGRTLSFSKTSLSLF